MTPILPLLLLVTASGSLGFMLLESLVAFSRSFRFESTFSDYGCLDPLSAFFCVVLGSCLTSVNGPATRTISGVAVFSHVFPRYARSSVYLWSRFGDAAWVKKDVTPLLR